MKSSDVRYHGTLYTSNQIFTLMKRLAKMQWHVLLWVTESKTWYVQTYHDNKDMEASGVRHANGPWKALQKVIEQVVIPYEKEKK